MTHDQIKQLVRFIVENSTCESRWLYPDPQHNINTRGLIDEICRLANIDTATMSAWINVVADEVDARMETL